MPAMRTPAQPHEVQGSVPSHSSTSSAGTSTRGRRDIGPHFADDGDSRCSVGHPDRDDLRLGSVPPWLDRPVGVECSRRSRSAKRRRRCPVSDVMRIWAAGQRARGHRDQRTSVISGPRSNGLRSSSRRRSPVPPGRGGSGRAHRAARVTARRWADPWYRGAAAASSSRGGRASSPRSMTVVRMTSCTVHGGRRLDRGAAAHDGPEEPSRPVEADEPGGHEDGAAVGARLRHPRQQLLTELTGDGPRPCRRSRRCSRAISLRMSIQTPSVRGAAKACSCTADSPMHRGDAGDLLLLLVDLEAQLHALAALAARSRRG